MSRAYPCARQRRLRLPLAADAHLERHQVLELLYSLAAAVAVARPADPLPFFLHFLRDSQNIKFCPRIMLLPSEEVSRSFSDVAAIVANMAGLELLTREDLVWGGVLSSDGVLRPPPVEEEQEEAESAMVEEEEEEEEEQQQQQEEEKQEDEQKEKAVPEAAVDAAVEAALVAAGKAQAARAAVGSLLEEGPLAEAVAAVTAARSTLRHAIEAATGAGEGGSEGGEEGEGGEEASAAASDGCEAALEAAAVAAGRPMRCWGCARGRAGVAARWLLEPQRQAAGWLLADVPASRAEAEALRRAGLLPTHLLQMRELLCPSHYEPPKVETIVAAAPEVAADAVVTSSVEWAAERSRASCVEPQAHALAQAHALVQEHTRAKERAAAAEAEWLAAAERAAERAAAAAAAAAAAEPASAGADLLAAVFGGPATAAPWGEEDPLAAAAAEVVETAVTAAAEEAEARAAAEAAAEARAAAAAAAEAKEAAEAAAAAAAVAAGVCLRTHRHERGRRQGPLLDEVRGDTEGVLSVFRHTPLVRVVAVRGGQHGQMALAALGQAVARRAAYGHSWVPRVLLVAPECADPRWHQRRLSYQFGLCPIDFLTLLREEPRPPQTSVERFSWSVPAARAAQLVTRRLAERDCVVSGWVMVGFPRDADDLRHLDASTYPPNRVFLFSNSVEWCLRNVQGGVLVRRARRAAGAQGLQAEAQCQGRGEPSVREMLAAARLMGARGEPLLRDSLGYARRLAGLRALCRGTAIAVDGERGRALVYHQLRAALAQAALPAPPRELPRRAPSQPHARFPSELPPVKSSVAPRSPAAGISPRIASAAPSIATVRSRLAASVPSSEEEPDGDATERVLESSLAQQ